MYVVWCVRMCAECVYVCGVVCVYVCGVVCVYVCGVVSILFEVWKGGLWVSIDCLRHFQCDLGAFM